MKVSSTFGTYNQAKHLPLYTIDHIPSLCWLMNQAKTQKKRWYVCVVHFYKGLWCCTNGISSPHIHVDSLTSWCHLIIKVILTNGFLLCLSRAHVHNHIPTLITSYQTMVIWYHGHPCPIWIVVVLILGLPIHRWTHIKRTTIMMLSWMVTKPWLENEIIPTHLISYSLTKTIY